MTSTDDPPALPPARERTWRGRVRSLLPAAVLGLVFVGVSIAVLPHMSSKSSPTVTTFDLDRSQSTPELRLRRASRNVYGFIVDPLKRGTAGFALPAPPPGADRTSLVVSAGGGPGVETSVSLVDGAGVRHLLGEPSRWHDQRLDVTPLIDGGSRLEFSALNGTTAPVLIGDRVRVVSYRYGALPNAGRWEVAAWVALATLLGSVAFRRARSHAPLVAGTAVAAWLVWPKVTAGALQHSTSDLWDAVVNAGWLGLDHGLLSGTFGSQSHLTVQLFHALTPIAGDGAPGARTASMLVGIAALIAVYVLGRRVAGTVGGVTVLVFALISDPFRLSLTSGTGAGTLILAAALFLIAVHRVLQGADRNAMVALGATGALAILAEPLWWPGVLAAIVLLAVRFSPPKAVGVSLGIAVLTLLLVSLPSRVSVAHQAAGDAAADVVERATLARDTEFPRGGHGGPQIGLAGYMLRVHSVPVILDSVLSGASDSLRAAGKRPETKLVGLVAFLLASIGVVFLLLLPRLRLLVVVAALVASVPWFFVARAGADPFIGGNAFWPILPLGAATLAYALVEVARQRMGTAPMAEGVVGRLSSLPHRAPRRAQTAKP